MSLARHAVCGCLAMARPRACNERSDDDDDDEALEIEAHSRASKKRIAPARRTLARDPGYSRARCNRQAVQL
jgi:hypothetical protein